MIWLRSLNVYLIVALIALGGAIVSGLYIKGYRDAQRKWALEMADRNKEIAKQAGTDAAEVAASTGHGTGGDVALLASIYTEAHIPTVEGPTEIDSRRRHAIVQSDQKDAGVRRSRIQIATGGGRHVPAMRHRPLPEARDQMMFSARVQESGERILLEFHADVIALLEKEEAQRSIACGVDVRAATDVPSTRQLVELRRRRVDRKEQLRRRPIGSHAHTGA